MYLLLVRWALLENKLKSFTAFWAIFVCCNFRPLSTLCVVESVNNWNEKPTCPTFCLLWSLGRNFSLLFNFLSTKTSSQQENYIWLSRQNTRQHLSLMVCEFTLNIEMWMFEGTWWYIYKGKVLTGFTWLRHATRTSHLWKPVNSKNIPTTKNPAESFL